MNGSQGISHEAMGGLSPEVVSPYEGLSHHDVIGRFIESRGEAPGIGVELTQRLLAHADLEVDPTALPLMHQGVQVVANDGRLLTWADYVDWASGRLSDSHQHSSRAMRGMLGFLQTVRGTAEYEAGVLGMKTIIQQSSQVG